MICAISTPSFVHGCSPSKWTTWVFGLAATPCVSTLRFEMRILNRTSRFEVTLRHVRDDEVLGLDTNLIPFVPEALQI